MGKSVRQFIGINFFELSIHPTNLKAKKPETDE